MGELFENDVRHARRKRRVGRIQLTSVRRAGAKTGLFSPCLFLQEQTTLKALVRSDDTCLEGKRGVARALESKLKERMLIKRRAELGWAKADDERLPLLG